MYAKVKRIDIDTTARMIVISDPHANLELFQTLLKKVNFQKEDFLFILGDFIEKGKESLVMLRYVMELAKQPNVHVLLGNCENVYLDCGQVQPLMRIPYFIRNYYTLGREIFKLEQREITPEVQVKEFYELLEKKYPDELAFLQDLPHIIETPLYTFVHGGIDPTLPLEEQSRLKAMKWDNFRQEGFRFKKYLICGHWPVINYCHEVASCNPILDHAAKIISIDGGYGIKNFGQINALIVEKDATFSYFSVDELEYKRVYEDQIPKKQQPFTIAYPDGEIKILQEGEEFSVCEHVRTGKKMRILKSLIYELSDKHYCTDATNYMVTVYRGDWVGLIAKTRDYSLVKKAGIIGWLNNIKIDREFQE